jgi:hypothetical protein
LLWGGLILPNSRVHTSLGPLPTLVTRPTEAQVVQVPASEADVEKAGPWGAGDLSKEMLATRTWQCLDSCLLPPGTHRMGKHSPWLGAQTAVALLHPPAESRCSELVPRTQSECSGLQGLWEK